MIKIPYVISTIIILSSALALADGGHSSPAPLPRESYINGLLGAAVTTSSGGGTAFSYGGRIGTSFVSTPAVLFSVGLDVGSVSSASTVGTVTVSATNTLLNAELLGRRMFQTGLYIGARFGLGFESATVSVSGASFSASAIPFAIGPVVGYELPIIPKLAINLDVSWVSVAGSTLNFVGLGSVQAPASSAFMFLCGVVFRW